MLTVATERTGEVSTFVTAWYAVYDPAQRSIRYACAGHVPPIVIDRHRDTHELCDVQDFPLAVQAGPTFPEGSVTLTPGDRLVLYTDGMIEAFNSQGEAFGPERMLAAMCGEGCSAQATIDCINSVLSDFTGGTVRQDDQTLLVLRAK